MSETGVPLSLIEEGVEYELLGCVDGGTYVLRFKPEKMAARIEGEDAFRFHADYEAIRRQFPNWETDKALAQLWDQGGYSWLAAQDG